MVLEYLLFNEGKSGAFVRILPRGGMSLTFQDSFYENGMLITRAPEEAEAESKIKGFAAYETIVYLTDINQFSTRIAYTAGELAGIDTKTPELMSVNPRKAFKFWLALSKALRENAETPEKVKENMGRIAHITSLEEHFEQLRTTGVKVDFNQGHLEQVKPTIAHHYA